MKFEPASLRLWLIAAALLILLPCAGCSNGDPASISNNPGVENPAAAAPNSIMPGVGTAGNGGGVTGGGNAAGH